MAVSAGSDAGDGVVMAKQRLITERVADLGTFQAVKAAGAKLPLWPQELAHIYVKLDFTDESENAATVEQATGFLRSVYRASSAAQRIAEQHNGFLLEVQGSTLHVGLQAPPTGSLLDSANEFVTKLHWAYRATFSDQKKRVQGWRMTVDAGKTLVVAGRGVHGDSSYVSLGQAANRPAKHLYAQLEIENEHDRELKRYHVGVRVPASSPSGRDTWKHSNLDRSPSRLTALAKITEEVQREAPQFEFLDAVTGWKQVQARALPIAPAGAPASPKPEKPHTYFGWVMRADLDGFTAAIQGCLDRNDKLAEMAEDFYCLMDAAAAFVERNKQTMAQLPWAGDNFTAAAVFAAKPSYDGAIPRQLVELTLEFEKDMADAAVECGFGGWAHGVAGGDVRLKSVGNVYLAGVEVGGRRFLVGVGEGFGRSTKAFGDINPKPNELVVYNPDWEKMDEQYKKAFEPAVTRRKEQSSLFRIGTIEGLRKAQARAAAAAVYTTTTSFRNEEPRQIPAKPHYK